MAYFVGSDIGGTFTDLVGYDSANGRIVYGKQLTNRGDLAEGVLDCLREVAVEPSEIDLLKHGTTQVINTLLERHGARAALVTTQGFRDVLEIGRAGRPVAFQLEYRRQAPLVARDLRFEVAERIDAQGRVLTALDMDGLAEVAKRLAEAGIEAVAVSFVNAYLNPAHEVAAAEYLRRTLPGVYVTTGCELSREWFEYERTSTAVANAYVGPRAAVYVDRFAERLSSSGFDGTFYMMASSGGIMTVDRSKESPIALVESGPIGGCVGAAVYARRLGIDRMIAFDMGGTTAKCALVENGRFEVQPTYYVGGYDHGFPLRTPVLDIVEVGTGGGSIAHVSEGRLHIGPRSAGSEPGPVAFRRGGTEPTVTDANLALDRISGGKFLNGALSLDYEGARLAILEKVGKALGYAAPEDVDVVAGGILSLANAQMAMAIKEITIERGRDTRDFTLLVFGGGGPMHGVDLARELRVPRVVIPAEPGNFSALGMLFADARLDSVRSLVLSLDEESVSRLVAEANEMGAPLLATLRQDFPDAVQAIEWQAEIRFRGQRHSLKIVFTAQDSHETLSARFFDTYRRQYGHVDERGEIELIGLRVSAAAATRTPELGDLHRAAKSGTPRPTEVRDIYAVSVGRRLPTPVFSRENLPIGFSHEGPIVIEEFGSTTVVGPGESIRVGDLGEIWVDLSASVSE